MPLDRLSDADLHVTLVSTLAAPMSSHFYRDLWNEALGRNNVTGLSLQPATYSGRHLLPQDLEDRITFPDVIRGLASASGGMIREDDFAPLPCAHPNCHQIMLAARQQQQLVPLGRAAPITENLDLIAGGLCFTPERSKQLMKLFLDRMSHCGSDCGCGDVTPIAGQRTSSDEDSAVLQRFFTRVLAGQATAKDLIRVTVTSFLDAYNFDVRQVMKCCTHHVLPSGHVVPFCAYNTLYRSGHLSLPPLSSG